MFVLVFLCWHKFCCRSTWIAWSMVSAYYKPALATIQMWVSMLLNQRLNSANLVSSNWPLLGKEPSCAGEYPASRVSFDLPWTLGKRKETAQILDFLWLPLIQRNGRVAPVSICQTCFFYLCAWSIATRHYYFLTLQQRDNLDSFEGNDSLVVMCLPEFSKISLLFVLVLWFCGY